MVLAGKENTSPYIHSFVFFEYLLFAKFSKYSGFDFIASFFNKNNK